MDTGGVGQLPTAHGTFRLLLAGRLFTLGRRSQGAGPRTLRQGCCARRPPVQPILARQEAQAQRLQVAAEAHALRSQPLQLRGLPLQGSAEAGGARPHSLQLGAAGPRAPAQSLDRRLSLGDCRLSLGDCCVLCFQGGLHLSDLGGQVLGLSLAQARTGRGRGQLPGGGLLRTAQAPLQSPQGLAVLALLLSQQPAQGLRGRQCGLELGVQWGLGLGSACLRALQLAAEAVGRPSTVLTPRGAPGTQLALQPLDDLVQLLDLVCSIPLQPLLLLLQSLNDRPQLLDLSGPAARGLGKERVQRPTARLSLPPRTALNSFCPTETSQLKPTHNVLKWQVVLGGTPNMPHPSDFRRLQRAPRRGPQLLPGRSLSRTPIPTLEIQRKLQPGLFSVRDTFIQVFSPPFKGAFG